MQIFDIKISRNCKYPGSIFDFAKNLNYFMSFFIMNIKYFPLTLFDAEKYHF